MVEGASLKKPKILIKEAIIEKLRVKQMINFDLKDGSLNQNDIMDYKVHMGNLDEKDDLSFSTANK